MKTWKNILFIVLAVTLIAGAIVLADTQRLGSDSYTFNATRTVTKTAAYSLTTSDSYVKFTASSGNIVATLPALSDATAGRRQSYKILKTDATTYKIIVTPASGETIGFESTRVLLSANAYMVIHAGPGSKNWTVDYETPYIVEDHAAGTYTTGIGSAGVYASPTVSATLTPSDCGTTYFILTDALTFTLPTGPIGCKLTFVNTGTAGNNIITIKSNGTQPFAGTTFSGAAISGTIISSLSGSALTNTKSTAKNGDLVELISTGATSTWIITRGTGTWTAL